MPRNLSSFVSKGKNMEALDILFADDVVSVEAVAMPSVQQELNNYRLAPVGSCF